jgi:hypothetical protein
MEIQRVLLIKNHLNSGGPDQILTFLGIEFDTLKMELRLPSEKKSEINITLELFMHVRKVTLRQLPSLIGLLNFAKIWSGSTVLSSANGTLHVL